MQAYVSKWSKDAPHRTLMRRWISAAAQGRDSAARWGSGTARAASEAVASNSLRTASAGSELAIHCHERIPQLRLSLACCRSYGASCVVHNKCCNGLHESAGRQRAHNRASHAARGTRHTIHTPQACRSQPPALGTAVLSTRLDWQDACAFSAREHACRWVHAK